MLFILLDEEKKINLLAPTFHFTTLLFMKRERKIYMFQLLIHVTLLVSIALAGVIAFFISHRPDGINYSSQPFLLALLNVVLLILVLIGVSVFINKLFMRLASSSGKIDELTGFMTRHAFSHVFEQVLFDTKRSMKPLSILLIDIDHFRVLNRNYGHRVGDELLAILAQSIQSAFRKHDITCRWGGDQILVVLNDCNERGACRLAGNILENFGQQALDRQGSNISITASIGISQLIDGDNAETIVTRAETGLCSARDNGRNTYAIGYEWILIDYALSPIF